MQIQSERVKAFTQAGLASKLERTANQLVGEGYKIISINQYGYLAIGRNKAGTIFYSR